MRKITTPIRVRRRGKKLIATLTRREARELNRQTRERKAAQKAEREHNQPLIDTLSLFISRHYANPATGWSGAIITGPIGARLFHAASLRALLIENEPVQR